MSIGDLSVLLAVGAMLALALRRLHKKKQSGCPGCCACCAGNCPTEKEK